MSGALEQIAGSVENTLRRVELFNDLDTQELERLGRRCVEVEFPRHGIVAREGERTIGLYVIREGSVAVFRETVGKPVQLLARLRHGEFFGALGIFGEGRHMASVRASEASRILRIARADLLTLFENHPEIEQKFHLASARRHLANVTSMLELGRRREVRIHLDLPVQLEVGEGSIRAAVLENLSLGGLCLADAPADWLEGRAVAFGLGLREGLLQLKGRVAWRRDETVGLVFEKLTPNHDTVIQVAIRVALEMKSWASAPGDTSSAS